MRERVQGTRRHGRQRSTHAWVVGMLLCGVSLAAQADQRIGAGAIISLADGTTSLGCTDLVVAGTLNFEQGTYLAVRNFSVLPGGIVNGGTGSLTLSGTLDVDPAGQFNAQALVVVEDASACGAAPAPAPAPLQIPTLGNPLLVTLAVLLLWLAHRRFRKPGALRRA